MINKPIDTKTIIHSKAIINDNYDIVSADEEYFIFVGTNIKSFLDTIHQVDMDDFTYVVDSLNEYEQRNMVVRIRRFDNSYRWCLLTVVKSNVVVEGKQHIEISISDIVNLNNHYVALTKAFELKGTSIKYSDLISCEELLDIAYNTIQNKDNMQVSLFIITINSIDDIRSLVGDEGIHTMLDDISNELNEYVGERGHIGRFGDNGFILMVNNIGNEPNLRSFMNSTRLRIKWSYINKQRPIDLSFTFATAEYPRNGKDFDIIKQKLYLAYDIGLKKNTDCYIIYKEELHGEIYNR